MMGGTVEGQTNCLIALGSCRESNTTDLRHLGARLGETRKRLISVTCLHGNHNSSHQLEEPGWDVETSGEC